MRISDWSSDVCSSDLARELGVGAHRFLDPQHLVPLRHAFGAREAADLELARVPAGREVRDGDILALARTRRDDRAPAARHRRVERRLRLGDGADLVDLNQRRVRSEEHTSELQSPMRISYAVFCLKKKNIINQETQTTDTIAK